MATSTTATQPLPQFAPYMTDYWSMAQDVAKTPYQQSPGTYVGPNDTLQAGWEAVTNRAINGNPAMSAAQQGLQNFYTQPQQGATRNPYGPVTAGTNNTQVSGGSNPYANHNNPYLTQQIDAAQGDVIRNWNNVQKPAWDTQMAGSGSFGNANIAASAGNASSDMQRNLGRISSDMRMGAYNQAAGLTESGLNRNFNAQTFNSGTLDNNLNRQYGAQTFNAGQGEQFAGRSDSMYGQNQNRMLNAYGMAPQFAQNDYLDANALLGVGAQQQGFNQAQQTQNSDWWNQAQGYAGNQLDAYGRRLGMMQSGQQTTQSTPDPSSMSKIIGGAVTGAGVANWWGG